MNHDDKKTSGSQLAQPTSTDSFDVDSLRLSQDFASSIGVKKLLTTVSVKKPNPQAYVRVHPDEAFRLPTAVLELKEDKELYLVARELWDELGEEIIPKMLYAAITRQGDPFIWPIRMPGEDGRLDPWNQSAHEAAQMAMEKWVRVKSNRSLGAYNVFESSVPLPEPTWPETRFNELLKIAFKERCIENHDHPVLRGLRGEI